VRAQQLDRKTTPHVRLSFVNFLSIQVEAEPKAQAIHRTLELHILPDVIGEP
jgi:hypothetical protein